MHITVGHYITDQPKYIRYWDTWLYAAAAAAASQQQGHHEQFELRCSLSEQPTV